MLGLPKLKDRVDKKPLEIMKAITAGTIQNASLGTLRETFKRSLALP
jgi:hypothetical protein